jgi:CRP-like cAMP-binding protein
MRNVTDRSVNKHKTLLSRVPLLACLAPEVMTKLAESVEISTLRDGDCVVRQGHKCDGFYIIISGLVHVIKTLPVTPGANATAPALALSAALGHDDGNSESFIVNQLQHGDYFGEKELLESGTRSCSVLCVGPVEVCRVDRYAFDTLLSPDPTLKALFVKRAAQCTHRDDLVMRLRKDLLSISPDTILRYRQKQTVLANQHPTYQLANLQRLGFLGKGGYGYVELVYNKSTDETFALKSLYRSHLIRTKSTVNIINEKKLLTKLSSPHIIKLHATFKDPECLYLLLEPCLGGELFTLLRVRTTFDDRSARFFAASVLLALEEMHRQGVVYRDLKPENLLLDAHGYIKVTDFGLSKEIYNARTFTVCGTPHYLSPEIIKGIGHTKAVDLWCFGVLIYEMLAGRPPFYRPGERGDHMKLYKRIASCNYQPSSLFAPEAWDLIQRLLQPNETHRIGYGSGEALSAIKNHPWFLGFDWAGLGERKLRAPIVPFLKTPEDTHNFKKANPNYVQPGSDLPLTEGDCDWDAEF